MRKKIILEVDKLVHRHPRKQPNDQPTRPHPEKKHSFDQMYRQAKKHQTRNCNPNALSQFHSNHSASNSFQAIYESLKASRNTPNNTHRFSQENKEKLNRSLQAKTNNIEKSSPIKRSRSSQRKKYIDKHKNQDLIFRKKSAKEQRAQLITPYTEWEGLQQFQSEWKTVISHLNHSQHQHLRETECFLSLKEIFEVLKTMHYVRKVEDEKSLLNLWRQLEGQTYGGVPINNLRQFLTIINYCPPNRCFQSQKGQGKKRVYIDNNLKIVMSEAAKLQIFQQYLPLRINRILYGSAASSNYHQQAQTTQSEKQLKRSNIKIQQQEGVKKKIVLGSNKKSSQKQSKIQPLRQKRSEQITRISEEQDRQHNQDTICYSEFSNCKESGSKILTSNESENSISNAEIIEEIVIKKPILSVDVNLGDGICQKLTVFEGQTALQVSRRLVEKYNIDETLRAKFQVMLSGHIRNLLYRIDEVSEQMFSDRQE